MVDFNLIADIGIDDTEAISMIQEAMGQDVADGDMDSILQRDIQHFRIGKVLQGKIVGKAGDDAVIDVGLKSEGLVNKSEFDDFDSLEMGDII